jgi:RimJ/RimL family protein N-acetyltransferase
MSDEFPQLETERLILRRLTASDTEFVFQYFSDPILNRYLMAVVGAARVSVRGVAPRLLVLGRPIP